MAFCSAAPPAKCRFQTYLASLANKTWAYKDRSTLADTHVTFVLTRIEPKGSKFEIRNSSLLTRNFHDPPRFLPVYLALRRSRDFGYQAPPLFCVRRKDRGDWGRGYLIIVLIVLQQYQKYVCTQYNSYNQILKVTSSNHCRNACPRITGIFLTSLKTI